MHAVEMPGQTTEMKLLAGPPLFVNLRCRLAYAALCHVSIYVFIISV